MKTFLELSEQQELDESWRNLAAGVLVIRIRGLSKKIKHIRYRRSNTHDENMTELFRKIDLLAEQNNGVAYLTGQLGVMRDEK